MLSIQWLSSIKYMLQTDFSDQLIVVLQPPVPRPPLEIYDRYPSAPGTYLTRSNDQL